VRRGTSGERRKFLAFDWICCPSADLALSSSSFLAQISSQTATALKTTIQLPGRYWVRTGRPTCDPPLRRPPSSSNRFILFLSPSPATQTPPNLPPSLVQCQHRTTVTSSATKRPSTLGPLFNEPKTWMKTLSPARRSLSLPVLQYSAAQRATKSTRTTRGTFPLFPRRFFPSFPPPVSLFLLTLLRFLSHSVGWVSTGILLTKSMIGALDSSPKRFLLFVLFPNHLPLSSRRSRCPYYSWHLPSPGSHSRSYRHPRLRCHDDLVVRSPFSPSCFCADLDPSLLSATGTSASSSSTIPKSVRRSPLLSPPFFTDSSHRPPHRLPLGLRTAHVWPHRKHYLWRCLLVGALSSLSNHCTLMLTLFPSRPCFPSLESCVHSLPVLLSLVRPLTCATSYLNELTVVSSHRYFNCFQCHLPARHRHLDVLCASYFLGFFSPATLLTLLSPDSTLDSTFRVRRWVLPVPSSSESPTESLCLVYVYPFPLFFPVLTLSSHTALRY
jgi:hypothetical protein